MLCVHRKVEEMKMQAATSLSSQLRKLYDGLCTHNG